MKNPQDGVGPVLGTFEESYSGGLGSPRGGALSETDQRGLAKIALVALERALIDPRTDRLNPGDHHRFCALRARWAQLKRRTNLGLSHAFLPCQAGAQWSLSHRRLARGLVGDAFHFLPIAQRVCAKSNTFKVGHCYFQHRPPSRSPAGTWIRKKNE